MVHQLAGSLLLFDCRLPVASLLLASETHKWAANCGTKDYYNAYGGRSTRAEVK